VTGKPRGAIRLGAFVLLVAACGTEHDPSAPAVRELSLPPDGRTDVEMAAQEIHQYPVSRAAGQYFAVVVHQEGVDLVLELRDPSGRPILTVDSPTGPAELERLGVLAETAGVYHLEARPFGGGEPRGAYGLEVRALRNAEPEDHLRAEAYLELVRGAALRPSADEAAATRAVRHLRRAAGLWSRLDDARGLGVALYELGHALRSLPGRDDEALATWEECLEPLTEAGSVWYPANALHLMGEVRLGNGLRGDRGETRAALESYLRALALRRRAGDRAGEARTLNQVGLVHKLLGEPQKALVRYDEAIALWERLGRPFAQARPRHNRGKVYLSLGRLDDAERDFSKALDLRRRQGNRLESAKAMTALAQVAEARSRGPEARRSAEARESALRAALEHDRQALSIFREERDLTGQGTALAGIGGASAGLGRTRGARESFRRALEIFRQLGDRREQGLAFLDIGSLLAGEGRHEEALAQYERSLGLFDEVLDRADRAATLSWMAASHRALGRLDRATEVLASAVALVEHHRTRTPSPGFRATYLATKQNYFRLFVDLLMERHERDPAGGFAARALEVHERSRARSLLETVSETGADPVRRADSHLVERERSLEAEIGRLQQHRLSLPAGGERAVDPRAGIEDTLRESLRQLELVRARIRSIAPAAGELPRTRPLTVPAIRRLLDEETVLLEYCLGPERSFVWALTVDGLSARELPPRHEIEPLALEAYALLSELPRREGRRRSAELLASLGESLVAPVAPLLAAHRRLLIVADGALQYLPFAALPDPTPGVDAAPLAARHELIHLPSASVLESLRRRSASRSPPDGLVAIVADPVFGPEDPRLTDAPGSAPAHSYPRLERTRTEAEAILRLVSPEESFAAFGFEATEDLLTGDVVGDYRILHLATHGEIDDAGGQVSRLVFSLIGPDGEPREGLLHAHELHRLHLASELVVLSACRTALGDEVSGEGLVGLTQGFFNAGASRLLVSLWAVDDAATAELVEAFYRQLLDGDPPPAALRAAQEAVRRRPAWRSPYFWAPFVLQGDWRWPESGARTTPGDQAPGGVPPAPAFPEDELSVSSPPSESLGSMPSCTRASASW
jgi:CHAT domain-containing protein/tetratricopeptide (TPR) repeat protein